MNIIGDFGRFMIQYQSQIEIFLIALAVIVAIVFAVKAAVNSQKKRKLLSEISETVSEIHTAVHTLGDKKSEVIYIDNRTAEPQTAGQAPEPDPNPDDALEILRAVTQTENPSPAVQTETAILKDLEPEPAAEAEAPKKYFSRESGTAKNGKTYTIEELERQIKE